jgi:hypothetical protein
VAVPPIISRFIVNAVAIAVAGGRFGVVTTTIVIYSAVTITPITIPFSSALFALDERDLPN